MHNSRRTTSSSSAPSTSTGPSIRRYWRRRSRRRRHLLLGRRNARLHLAVGQPDVIDGVVNGVESGARGVHPAGEDALDLAIEADLVDLDERVRLRRQRRRTVVADAGRHLQRTELHRLVYVDIERGYAPGDLVEAVKNGDGIGDAAGLGRNGRTRGSRRLVGGRGRRGGGAGD